MIYGSGLCLIHGGYIGTSTSIGCPHCQQPRTMPMPDLRTPEIRLADALDRIKVQQLCITDLQAERSRFAAALAELQAENQRLAALLLERDVENKRLAELLADRENVVALLQARQAARDAVDYPLKGWSPNDAPRWVWTATNIRQHGGAPPQPSSAPQPAPAAQPVSDTP